jgi:hypothetical protein
MKKKSILIVFLLLTTAFSFGQTLTYKSGRVFNSENHKLTPNEVRELFANKPELLSNYNSACTKKTVGNILLAAGIGFIVGDLASGATADIQYPTAFTFIGLISIAIAIPVKIGFSKKIRTSVEEYNKQIAINNSKYKIENATLYANQNGLGIRISF